MESPKKTVDIARIAIASIAASTVRAGGEQKPGQHQQVSYDVGPMEEHASLPVARSCRYRRSHPPTAPIRKKYAFLCGLNFVAILLQQRRASSSIWKPRLELRHLGCWQRGAGARRLRSRRPGRTVRQRRFLDATDRRQHPSLAGTLRQEADGPWRLKGDAPRCRQ